ncbi:MAG: type II toxin-antitoxin system HicB family antitoxin [Chloroflexi bacterium]|nr:type II toxin-antitoxin system HicB family antitoxin [Chloroflexota bacterium]
MASVGPEGRVWREDDAYVSFWPTLEVYSQGDTPAEARENLSEAARLFVESCRELGTLEAVLRSRSAFRYFDPE